MKNGVEVGRQIKRSVFPISLLRQYYGPGTCVILYDHVKSFSSYIVQKIRKQLESVRWNLFRHRRMSSR